ncbi:Methyltransferase-related protein [Cordyceps fumosorosea ARSEF 2679]|uniref:Ribosomal RNA-processing protein 8 n=1 Tax=Cordyceps fumosorosea (strain ARSEF 2679) TaxID=1081104 RepID=A0A167UCJ0_CORFA|nr:Methyltransferase-related protein [Cordyceps fumosorosea ARSEF 2679]OAA61449.1 Methyltransferase-related protein [Cordyceps fumosorosea ARSEF 2679]
MFAVPGWSISADSLKAETASPSDGAAPGKKRKRAGRPRDEAVNADNVTQLYESVVEGKNPNAPKKDKSTKRQKKNGATGDDAQPNDNEGGKGTKLKQEPQGDSKKAKDARDQKKKKKSKHENHVAECVDNDSPAAVDAKEQKAAAIPTQLPPAPPKLTPLQAAMREKLISARFRHLNETLYTKPSEESFSLFQDSPEMFDEYHEGFRRQVKVWPENPVDSFLKDIRSRGKIRQPFKGKPGAHPSSLATSPLPRTGGTCTIADLGCGDAALAQSLEADKGKMRIDVKSYDLQSPHALVTKADIANLPLEEGSVNVAIFCLALMGTNWIDFIEEAFRILHWKGELWVAEIKSRFGPVRNKHAPVEHSVGNRKKVGKKGKGGGGGADAADPMDLAVEVDGAEDNRKATDVSAFVDALQKRGFVLNGERSEAVDLSNKMFVKMRFIKGATPTKGRAAKAPEPGRGKKPSFAPKIADEGDKGIDETAILKPCVYKIR